MAESLGVNTMISLRIPDEIRNALALKTADRYNIPFSQATAWMGDIERKGTQSIFFEQVKPVALDFFGPILSAIMPAIQSIITAAVTAGVAQARAINDSDYGTDIGPDGIPILDSEAEALIQHVDDPNGEKELLRCSPGEEGVCNHTNDEKAHWPEDKWL